MRSLLLLILFCTTAAVAAPQNPPMTEQQMFEFSSLPHKGNITTGFFQCMAKHQHEKGEQQCLPAELKFQTHVLATVVKEYMDTLSRDQRQQLAKVQQAFTKYRDLRCGWYARSQNTTDSKLKQTKCILAMTMSRRLELERFVPMTED